MDGSFFWFSSNPPLLLQKMIASCFYSRDIGSPILGWKLRGETLHHQLSRFEQRSDRTMEKRKQDEEEEALRSIKLYRYQMGIRGRQKRGCYHHPLSFQGLELDPDSRRRFMQVASQYYQTPHRSLRDHARSLLFLKEFRSIDLQLLSQKSKDHEGK